MARNKTGGSTEDYLADTAGNRLAGEDVGFYRDAACTTRITDLLDANGTPITEATTDADGYWGTVQFPDDGTTYAYAARLHPDNGAPIAPGRLVGSHTALANHAAQEGQPGGPATLDSGGVLVQPVPYANVTGTPDLTPYALQSEVPSIEEVAVSVPLLWPAMANPINRDTTTATRTCPLLCLPYSWYLLSVEMVWGATVATSDTDYWTVGVQNRDTDASSTVTIATKTTQVTGGEAITIDRPWRFDSGSFDAGARLFDVDQTLRVSTTPTNPGATLPSLSGPSVAVVRYARQ